MQRILIFVYIAAAAAFSFYSVVTLNDPALFVIKFFAPNPGDLYSATLVLIILFILLLLPVVALFIVQRLLRERKPDRVDPDSSGIYVSRQKAMQSALIGIPVYIHGKKAGVVENGGTKFFPLPAGEFTVQAGHGKRASVEIRERLGESEKLYFTCVARDAGLHVQIDLEMLDRDLR